MIRRFIQAVPLALIAICAVGGFLGLRALVWRQEYQAVAQLQSGLLVSTVVSAVVGAGYVLMGSLLWRLLKLDWLSLQFGAIVGALLYGGYNALPPLTPLSTGEIPLWRALQGGMDGLLIGVVLGALVMTISQQPLHLDRGGLVRYLILYVTLILLAWLVLLTETLLHLPQAAGAVVAVPLLIVLRFAVAWLDRRADSRTYRYDEG